jgi:uncharacterized peroxidase-related enzyme
MFMARLTTVSVGPGGNAPGQPALDCNFLRLLANSSAALSAYQAYLSTLSRGQLTPRQRELLALALAEINGSSYCLSAHYAQARRLGLTDAEIRAARRARSADRETQAILRFAQSVTLQRGEISDADFLSLRQAGVEDALIAEIVSHIALNIFTNYFNMVARTQADFPLLKPGADMPERA